MAAVWHERLKAYFRKLGQYKYIALLVAVGLVLVMWPDQQEKPVPVPQQTAETPTPSLQEELCRMLSQIDGAGQCSVLLTAASGGRTIYQTDKTTQAGESGTSKTETTVILSPDNSQEEALVVQKMSPTYQGALVVCEGGGSSTVRLSIVQAVSALTGLGADQITVIKMK